MKHLHTRTFFAVGLGVMGLLAMLPGDWAVYGAPNLDVTVTPRGTAPLFPFITPEAAASAGGGGNSGPALALPTVAVPVTAPSEPVTDPGSTPPPPPAQPAAPTSTPVAPVQVATPVPAAPTAASGSVAPGPAATPPPLPTVASQPAPSGGGSNPAPAATPVAALPTSAAVGVAPAGGSGSAPAPAQPPRQDTVAVQVPVDATQAARLTLGDGLVTVVVPPEAIPNRGEVSGALTALTQRQRQALERSGIQATNLAASVGVTPQQDLTGPAQVSVHYAPEQVAGLDPRSLSMFRYDAASDSWKALDGCRSQPTQFRVECTLQGGLGVLLLGGAAPTPAGAPSLPWAPLAAGAGVLLAGGAAVAWRLRRSGP